MIPGTGPPADEVERIVTLNKRVLLDGKRDAQFDPDGEVLLIRALPLFPENGCGSNLVVLRWSITIAGTIALGLAEPGKVPPLPPRFIPSEHVVVRTT
jgi:hypothetical protein